MEEKIEPLNKLDRPRESRESQYDTIKSSKPITVGVTIIILIVFITLIIIILFLYNKSFSTEEEEENEEEKSIFPNKIEISLLMYGTKYSNISYATDTISNSFKIGGNNYKEELGNINNGNDYKSTDRNTYTLFIPYALTKNKDSNNSIILFIHGELWTKGDKEYIEPIADIYAQSGYITAVMDYTLLSDDYKEYNNNIFRILDEITSCINSIKNKLQKEGFNETKLDIALGGYSSGAHLALLYGYSMNNVSLPIKFIIDISGPVTLEPQFWKKMKGNETLENIEQIDIEKAINEDKIIDSVDDDYFLLSIMNSFLGKKYTDEELNKMLNNKKINEDNNNYKELLNLVKYAFPSEYINNNTIPTLCVYGGNDTLIGIEHYSYLKSNCNRTDYIYGIYSRYSEHSVINYSSESNINAMREMYYQILNFSKTFFNSYL